MKTLLFYIFYSEDKKLYYSTKSDLIDLEEILKIINRRIKLSENNIGDIIDFDFETSSKEENKIIIYNKFGNLDFLGDKYKPLILKIVNSNSPSSYYSSIDSGNSEYYLDLVEINSFLNSLKKHFEDDLIRLRKNITITRLFG
jgi:hypothetical protein